MIEFGTTLSVHNIIPVLRPTRKYKYGAQRGVIGQSGALYSLVPEPHLKIETADVSPINQSIFKRVSCLRI